MNGFQPKFGVLTLLYGLNSQKMNHLHVTLFRSDIAFDRLQRHPFYRQFFLIREEKKNSLKKKFQLELPPNGVFSN